MMRREKLKRLYSKYKEKLYFVMYALAIQMNQITYCRATDNKEPDVSSVTKPLDTLKVLVLAVIGGYGVIILAKNVSEFAQAYQQQDSSGMHSALKGIVGGLMMAGISTVIGLIQGS